MAEFQNYLEDGKPVADIRQWCKDHGEYLLHYEREIRVVDEYGIHWVTEEGQMPESWWANRRIDRRERNVKTWLLEP